jgi:hypothetical protein
MQITYRRTIQWCTDEAIRTGRDIPTHHVMQIDVADIPDRLRHLLVRVRADLAGVEYVQHIAGWTVDDRGINPVECWTENCLQIEIDHGSPSLDAMLSQLQYMNKATDTMMYERRGSETQLRINRTVRAYEAGAITGIEMDMQIADCVA